MNCKEKLTQVLRANYKRNYTMQETSLPTTKAAQCPKCGKYHALIAIEMCNKNALLNGLQDKCEFICVNAFDVLKNWTKEGKQWDFIVMQWQEALKL